MKVKSDIDIDLLLDDIVLRISSNIKDLSKFKRNESFDDVIIIKNNNTNSISGDNDE